MPTRLRDRLLKRADSILDEADALRFYVTTPDELDSWQNLADYEEKPQRLSVICDIN